MFKRTLRGKVTLKLSPEERVLLLNLYHQMQDLLDTPDVPLDQDPLAALVGLDGPTEAPSDPAVARLFPAAYIDDELAATDFRRFTEPDLRNEKMTNLSMVSELLDEEDSTSQKDSEYVLSPDEVTAWLKSLNDLRLVLGTRIGVGDEYQEEQVDDPGFHLYDYLTYLQGTLIDAL